MKKIKSDLNSDDIDNQISFLRRKNKKTESDPTFPDCNQVYDVTPLRTIQTIANKISKDCFLSSPLRDNPDYGEGSLQKEIEEIQKNN
jgi:hypothetical protein